jgi:hypothetical protein
VSHADIVAYGQKGNKGSLELLAKHAQQFTKHAYNEAGKNISHLYTRYLFFQKSTSLSTFLPFSTMLFVIVCSFY